MAFPYYLNLSYYDSGCSICVVCGWVSQSGVTEFCEGPDETYHPDGFADLHSMVLMTPALQAGIVISDLSGV